nr:DUF533 domain-containing protein [uncultured Brevundimonas sp.]
MNPQTLLGQFLGPDTRAAAGDKLKSATGALSSPNAKVALGGVAAGGLLGLLVGSKKARKTAGKLAGGVVGYGGAAALGALAHRAYQKWQDQKDQPALTQPGHAADQPAPSAAHTTVAPPPPVPSQFDPTATTGADGRPFALALVRAMIAAANADGHIDADERNTILTHLATLQLDDEDKAFVFEALMSPLSVGEVASLANGAEQATEIYLVSRMAIDPDDPAERHYLDDLARHLTLPPDLATELETQVKAQEPIAA